MKRPLRTACVGRSEGGGIETSLPCHQRDGEVGKQAGRQAAREREARRQAHDRLAHTEICSTRIICLGMTAPAR